MKRNFSALQEFDEIVEINKPDIPDSMRDRLIDLKFKVPMRLRIYIFILYLPG